MGKSEYIYVVSWCSQGVPDSVDGEWSGALAAFVAEADAVAFCERIESNASEEYSWLGTFSKDEDGESVSDRGFVLQVENIELFLEQSIKPAAGGGWG